MISDEHRPCVVIGAGPAGLTAAYLLAKKEQRSIVLEKDTQVGGIAKTVVEDGYRFDLGGHRFFTKSQEVDDLWHEVLGEEFLNRPRLSRIYWNRRYLDYPLSASDVVKKLGPVELTRAFFSYLRAQFKRKGNEITFEEWVTNRFGKRLFQLFFKSYTEKVWGVPTSEIRAEWAAQRIKGLSFFSAAKAALFGNKNNKVKSLISEFHYPRYGPGQLWEAMTDQIVSSGSEVRLEAAVERIDFENGRVVAVWSNGERIETDTIISSLPLRDVARIAHPALPAELIEQANGLRYRDFLTVALIVDGEDLFPDNWIYIHDPSVEVGRIQNYRSWSPWMVPDEDKACVGMEYFCFEGDSLWTMPDEELVEFAKKEIERLGLCEASKIECGYVVRVPKAYPMYDIQYAERVDAIRAWLDATPNLHQIGRNGLHRYNNSDHSMLTAMRTIENLVEGTDHDIWAVNADSVYHEEDQVDEQPYRNAPETPAMKAGG